MAVAVVTVPVALRLEVHGATSPRSLVLTVCSVAVSVVSVGRVRRALTATATVGVVDGLVASRPVPRLLRHLTAVVYTAAVCLVVAQCLEARMARVQRQREPVGGPVVAAA